MSRPPNFPRRRQSAEPTPTDASSLLATTAVALAIPVTLWVLSSPMVALATLGTAALLGVIARTVRTTRRLWYRDRERPPDLERRHRGRESAESRR